MWKNGTIDGCEYWIKVYDEPSIHGIDQGKVSKLTVKRDGHEIINFDRGWDQMPQTQEDQAILEKLLKMYN